MQNETIDKLKEAGYITITDDSQGIADKVGIGGGSDFPYQYQKIDNFSFILDESYPRGVTKIGTFEPKFDSIHLGIGRVDNDIKSIGTVGGNNKVAAMTIVSSGPSILSVYFIFGETYDEYPTGSIVINFFDQPSYPIDRKEYKISDICVFK